MLDSYSFAPYPRFSWACACSEGTSEHFSEVSSCASSKCSGRGLLVEVHATSVPCMLKRGRLFLAQWVSVTGSDMHQFASWVRIPAGFPAGKGTFQHPLPSWFGQGKQGTLVQSPGSSEQPLGPRLRVSRSWSLALGSVVLTRKLEITKEASRKL